MGFGKQSPGVRQPAIYHILKVRRYGTSDSTRTDKRLIRRIQNGDAALQAFPHQASGFDVAGYDLIGFGVRVYDGQYAFSSRADKQLEIQTLGVCNSIVVTFTNVDLRIAGLLRIDGTGSDNELLSNFFGAANRRTRSGDRTKFEIYLGVPGKDEAQVATLLRRSEVVRTIDSIMRNAIAQSSHLHRFPDRDPCVRWIYADDFDLRVDTGNGQVSIGTGGSNS